MNASARYRLVALLGLVVIACGGPAQADKPVPSSELAVDQVSIKGGPRLLGSVLGREADGALALAVSRDWLKKTHPQFYGAAVRDESIETRAALIELRDRIAEWQKARPSQDDADDRHRELALFLKSESERVEKDLGAVEAGGEVPEEGAPFLVVDVPAAKIERVVNQQPARRAVAYSAWQEHLADVETRSAASLAQELKKHKVEPTDDPDALLDLLPIRRENDSAWAARKAVVEYQLRKPLDFQGTGNVIFPAGAKMQGVNAAKLLHELMQSLTGGSLEDLLDPPAGSPARPAAPGARPADEAWLPAATKAASEADVGGFRVTRVQQHLEARRIEVETRFVARLDDGAWKTVWRHVEKADAAKPRDDAERQILQDPQVRAALDLVKAIGQGAEDQVKLAVRFGAATMEAQKQADARFFQFRDRYLHRLDGPVLRIPPATPKGAKK